MLKSQISLNQEVLVRGKGRAVVIDLTDHRCYVKVQFNSGEESLYDVDYMKPAPPAKQKKPWAVFNPQPAAMYAYMGFAAADSAFWMPTSTTESLFQDTWEELEEVLTHAPEGVTVAKERVGNAFDMVGTCPPCDLDVLGQLLGVKFRPFFSNKDSKHVLLHGARKAWFFHFLRHGF